MIRAPELTPFDGEAEAGVSRAFRNISRMKTPFPCCWSGIGTVVYALAVPYCEGGMLLVPPTGRSPPL